MASDTYDSSSSDLSADDVWETELEIALLKNAGLADVRAICKCRPVPHRLRRDLWRLCLRNEATSAEMSSFTEIYDLPSQAELHLACEMAAGETIKLISKSALTDSDDVPSVLQLTSDFESVLTHFSQTYSIPFLPHNGWVPILSVLYTILRPLDREDLYAYFTSMYHRFLPAGTQGILRVCSTFRLLLQYHEPQLCNFLDSCKLGPEIYAKAWFESLFVDCVSNEALPQLWDIYFLLGEPHFGMLIALVLLVNAKDALMKKGNDLKEPQEALPLGDNEGNTLVFFSNSRDDVLFELRNLPKPMQPSDLVALVDITRLYNRRTPSSFHTNYLPFLFGIPSSESDNHLVDGALSLLISVEEVLNTGALWHLRPHLPRVGADDVEASKGTGLEAEEEEEAVRFLLVDCRPADQYNAGHLATAFYLDTELLLSNPLEFNTSVQALLQTQQRGIISGSKAVGEHIVFMGSGRVAEDRVAHMVIAHFLRLNTPYVSMADGGYAAFHEALGPLELNHFLVSHEEDLCFVCAANQGQKAIRMARKKTYLAPEASVNTDSSLISTTPRASPVPPSAPALVNVFSKFSNLIKRSQTVVSTTAQTTSTAPPPRKPASYRNTAAVFSIGDDDEDDDESPMFAPRPNSPTSTTVPPPVVATNIENCFRGQLIDLRSCNRMPGVNASFECMFLDPNEMPSYRGVILVSEKHLVVVREREKQLFEALGNFVQKTFLKKAGVSKPFLDHQQGHFADGVIEISLSMDCLKKITSKKTTPEIITFHYVRLNEDLLSETQESIRLLIPEAGDAVKVIKSAVFNINIAG